MEKRDNNNNKSDAAKEPQYVQLKLQAALNGPLHTCEFQTDRINFLSMAKNAVIVVLAFDATSYG